MPFLNSNKIHMRLPRQRAFYYKKMKKSGLVQKLCVNIHGIFECLFMKLACYIIQMLNDKNQLFFLLNHKFRFHEFSYNH